MHIRPYLPRDAGPTAEIFHEAVHGGAGRAYDAAQRNAWSPAPRAREDWHARLSATPTWVAEVDGGLVGFITWVPPDYVDFTYVRPAWHSQGVADALYATLEARARTDGATRLWAHASDKARRFFARMGFRVGDPDPVERAGVTLPRWIVDKDLTERAPTTLLRPARPADVRRILALEAAAGARFASYPSLTIPEDLSPEAALRDSIAAGHAFVVEAYDAPVGFVYATRAGDALFVEELSVSPLVAGQRLGARLLDALDHVAHAEGRAALALTTFRDVPFNAPYYRRLGFKDHDDGILRDKLAEEAARGFVLSERVSMRRPCLRPTEPR